MLWPIARRFCPMDGNGGLGVVRRGQHLVMVCVEVFRNRGGPRQSAPGIRLVSMELSAPHGCERMHQVASGVYPHAAPAHQAMRVQRWIWITRESSTGFCEKIDLKLLPQVGIHRIQ